MIERPRLLFDRDDAQAAGDQWGFNCGPGALCAVLGMTPEEIRPYLLDFEAKCYTNPTLMFSILNGMGIEHHRSQNVMLGRVQEWPKFGLARIQWEGPWTQPGVPIKARYRHTHWVGTCRDHFWSIFDINRMGAGGWIPATEWSEQFVPWLLKQVEPKASGDWHVTHGIEIEPIPPWDEKMIALRCGTRKAMA